jgi:hypothetical protein
MEVDFVQDFTENPYFSRPQFLDSGRVLPEVAQGWRVEDDIESSKDTGKWSSVASRIEKRRQEGRKRCRRFGKSPVSTEEISYLTVDCDFQEVDVLLPTRVLARSVERGFYYEAENSKLPIEGPKTLEEVEEERKQEGRVSEHMDFYMKHRIEFKPEVVKDWDRWIPRVEEIDLDPKSQTTVLAGLDDMDYLGEYSWNLRKGMEWADFKFLVNSKLGRDDWEAYTNGYIWDGKLCNGRVDRPCEDQRIRVTPEGHQSVKFQRLFDTRERAMERIMKKHPNWNDWALSEEDYEAGLGKKLAEDLEDENPYATGDLPIVFNDGLVSVQVPAGNEWAYFTAFMDSYLGEDKWIACFECHGEIVPWTRAEYVPRRNQYVIVRMLAEEQIVSSASLCEKRELLTVPQSDLRNWREQFRRFAEIQKDSELKARQPTSEEPEP